MLAMFKFIFARHKAMGRSELSDPMCARRSGRRNWRRMYVVLLKIITNWTYRFCGFIFGCLGDVYGARCRLFGTGNCWRCVTIVLILIQMFSFDLCFGFICWVSGFVNVFRFVVTRAHMCEIEAHSQKLFCRKRFIFKWPLSSGL